MSAHGSEINFYAPVGMEIHARVRFMLHSNILQVTYVCVRTQKIQFQVIIDEIKIANNKLLDKYLWWNS